MYFVVSPIDPSGYIKIGNTYVPKPQRQQCDWPTRVGKASAPPGITKLQVSRSPQLANFSRFFHPRQMTKSLPSNLSDRFGARQQPINLLLGKYSCDNFLNESE